MSLSNPLVVTCVLLIVGKEKKPNYLLQWNDKKLLKRRQKPRERKLLLVGPGAKNQTYFPALCYVAPI